MARECTGGVNDANETKGRSPKKSLLRFARRVFHERVAAAASYQIGEVQSRSSIVFGSFGSLHAAGRSPSAFSPLAFRFSAKARHWRAVQRQLGFSSTRT